MSDNIAIASESAPDTARPKSTSQRTSRRTLALDSYLSYRVQSSGRRQVLSVGHVLHSYLLELRPYRTMTSGQCGLWLVSGRHSETASPSAIHALDRLKLFF